MCGAEQQLPYCLELPTLPKKCLMVDEDDPEMSDHQETLDAKVSVRHQCPSCPVSVVSSVHRVQSVGQRASRLCGDRVQAASSSQLST